MRNADRAQPGSVYLVGGGPGDPGLITVRGLALLRTAAVIVHDRLIPRALLHEAAAASEVIDVSKVRGRRSKSQRQINDLLVQHARQGRGVVRLKGGDPFIFGRGREELEACCAAGLPVFVVPGVTSATSVPAAAGVPLTHRGRSRTFAVITGESDPELGPYEIPYAALVQFDTLVILMGLLRLPEITAELVAAGLAAQTPAVGIQSGWTDMQRVVTGTAGTIAERVRAAGLTSPVVTVIGQVAEFADVHTAG